MKAWLLTFILCASTVAQADWMLIQQSGTKPQRAAIFADILSLTDSSSGLKAAEAMLDKNPEALKQLDEHDRRYKPLRLVEVCESQPETRYLSLELDGDQHLYRILDAREFRHDARFLDLTAPGWRKLADVPWGKAAETFAFQQEPWREAMSHVLKSTDQHELQALGYEVVHNHSDADFPDLMWKYFWTDGTRPPADENALTLAKIGYVLKLDDKERANRVQALEAVQTKLAARPRPQHSEASASADGSMLGSWVGAPESELIASWGEPFDFSARGGVRSLTYRKERVIDIMSGNMKVGEEVYWSTVTFEVSQGRIFQYSTGGNEAW